MPKSFLDSPEIERRNKLIELLVVSLAHFPRDRALATIMMWIPQDDLESLAPTLSGDPDILSKLPGKKNDEAELDPELAEYFRLKKKFEE